MADPHYDTLTEIAFDEAFSINDQNGFWDTFAEFGYDAGLSAGAVAGQSSGIGAGIMRGVQAGYDAAVEEHGRTSDGFMRGYLAGLAAAPSGNDTQAPTITIVGPPPGSAIGPGTPLVFRYSDNNAIRRAMPCVKIKQPGTTAVYKYELIHDGENFTPDYTGTKTVIQAANPQIIEFSVTRNGGWTSPITYYGVSGSDPLQLVPFGFDTGGNEPA